MQFYDVAIVGAGPAGMACAVELSNHGVSVLLLDEQTKLGGQVYRNIQHCSAAQKNLLGSDYTAGLPLANSIANSSCTYLAGASVWQAEKEGKLFYSQNGTSHKVDVAYIVNATGAMERPVPFAGWTLPHVITAGGASNAYKDSQHVPTGPVVLAGNGPLLLLEAVHLLHLGVAIQAILDTGPALPTWNALTKLPKALRRAPYLLKGAAMLATCKKHKVPYYHSIRNLRAHGEQAVERVTATVKDKELSFHVASLITHFGVIPATALCNQIGCRLAWNQEQRYWYPVTDAWGRTTEHRIFTTGDGAGIEGAQAAALRGKLSALEIATSLGRIPASQRDELAAPLRAQLHHECAPRPFVDAIFTPSADWYPLDADTLICRCEHVTIGDVKEAVRKGCTNVNDIKALIRTGMGPCQGRMCANGLTEVVAALQHMAPHDMKPLRIRPPLKPIPLQELATLAQLPKEGA